MMHIQTKEQDIELMVYFSELIGGDYLICSFLRIYILNIFTIISYKFKKIILLQISDDIR